MKNLVFALTFLATAGCIKQNSDVNARTVITRNTLTHKAYYYYGLSETKDRQTIKDITGVDPIYTEWCAAFVNMVLLENGYNTSSSVSPHPLMARSFLTYGMKVEAAGAKQGDILVFERGNQGWQGHVAFYVSEKIIDGDLYYYVLGGNQSDAVTVDLYPARKIIDIRRPMEPA